MFDINKTLELVKGALVDPEGTWDRYLPEAADWKNTAIVLTGPLIVASGLLSYILGMIFSGRTVFLPSPTIVSTLTNMLVAAVAAVVIAFVVAFLAGVFKGKNSFPLALAATSLAFVPGYLGQALVHLPWIGGLLSLGLGIYGLVLLWRILPKYLDVPDTSHAGHYISSLVASAVALVVLGGVLGTGMVGGGIGAPDFSYDGSAARSGSAAKSGSGAFAGLERQGKIIEAADNDTYDPPRNGRLSRAQVENFVGVMSKTREYRDSQAKALKDLGEKAEKNESASWGDAISGMAGVMNLTTAEMEVVKTGGGNWAEHQWIKEQLHVARIQKDINASVEHNYEMYLEFQEQLEDVGQW